MSGPRTSALDCTIGVRRAGRAGQFGSNWCAFRHLGAGDGNRTRDSGVACRGVTTTLHPQCGAWRSGHRPIVGGTRPTGARSWVATILVGWTRVEARPGLRAPIRRRCAREPHEAGPALAPPAGFAPARGAVRWGAPARGGRRCRRSSVVTERSSADRESRQGLSTRRSIVPTRDHASRSIPGGGTRKLPKLKRAARCPERPSRRSPRIFAATRRERPPGAWTAGYRLRGDEPVRASHRCAPTKTWRRVYLAITCGVVKRIDRGNDPFDRAEGALPRPVRRRPHLNLKTVFKNGTVVEFP